MKCLFCNHKLSTPAQKFKYCFSCAKTFDLECVAFRVATKLSYWRSDTTIEEVLFRFDFGNNYHLSYRKNNITNSIHLFYKIDCFAWSTISKIDLDYLLTPSQFRNKINILQLLQ